MLSLIVVLVATVIVGTTLGQRWDVAPPVFLLCAGALLGLIPALHDVPFDPDVVLLLFLPALLYWESLNTSLREIWNNLRVIVLTSVFLVLATMAVVAYSAQALGVDDRASWVLGAVLAPTDAAAVAGLAKRMPRRTLTTLRAESLINDGTALVLYAIAVSVAVGGDMPGPVSLLGRFVGSYAGGIAAGLAVSGAGLLIGKRLDDPLREGALSVLTPFAAFLVAEEIHSSGVVAVVTAGLVFTFAGPYVIGARSRVQAFNFWDLGTFMLNGSLFVFVGIQFRQAAGALDDGAMVRATWVALGVTAAVVGTRMVWLHTTVFVIRAADRRPAQRLRRVGWRVRTASGWAGFRGAVSLATALAVPRTTHSGIPFPDRNLIVYCTCIVIFLTILIQGLTLPFVLRWANLPEDTGRAEELALARTTASEAALEALPRIASELGVDDDLRERLQHEYEEHMRTMQAEDGGPGEPDSDLTARHDLDRQLRLAVLETKRRSVTQLRNANRIDDIVLRELQAAIDLEEVRLLGPVTTE